MRSAGQPGGASRRDKAASILTVAADVFLDGGFLGSSMDEIAARASVSKQTVYKHFESKERLFVAVVIRMTADAGDEVLASSKRLSLDQGVERFLTDYAVRQLTTVVTPRLMRLRRLVIGEAGRFPELGRVLAEGGPQRAQARLASLFAELEQQGHLRVADPPTAASQFNWLVMAEPVNRAMLLGDAGIPPRAWLEAHAAEAVRLFLTAYGSSRLPPAEKGAPT